MIYSVLFNRYKGVPVNLKNIYLCLLLHTSLTYTVYNRSPVSIRSVHVNELYFPSNFLFGFAIAEQQNSGEDNLPDSNWTRWERTTWPNGKPHIERGERSGSSADHWNRYKEDIDLMKKDFNTNTFRFSLAWDRIEPREGEFNQEAIQHYIDEVDALNEVGIVPMVTLHHFAHPTWFEDKGAFEKQENIAYFVRFAKKIFEALGAKVPLWCTINEPGIYVFQGYLPWNCKFPPGYAPKNGKKSSAEAYAMGAKVLQHLMQAHTEVYRALKALPSGDKAQIGLAHQHLKFEPYSWWNPVERYMGHQCNDIICHSIIDFLKTGKFSYANAQYKAPEGKISDFIGLNYYSRVLCKMKLGNLWSNDEDDHIVIPSCYEHETMTDMDYAIYPEGIYEAIKEVAQTGLPIYITENGIDDRHEYDWRRAKWFAEYLKMVSLALEDGYDVRGYYCWTLTKNFEWDMGWGPRFGVYDVDLVTKKRTLKDGARIYGNIIRATREGRLEKSTHDVGAQENTQKLVAKL